MTVQISDSRKYITEFIATAMMVLLGNGSVANVDLKGTKGMASGWIVIAFGYCMGVMMPALMFGNVSGNHINPAYTLGLAVSDMFPWKNVPMYIVCQFCGAIFGQLLVVVIYRPYYQREDNPNHILGSFVTICNCDDGTPKSRLPAIINGFLNEFVGSFVLFFGATALTKNYFGVELAGNTSNVGCMAGLASSLETAHVGIGFLVLTLVTSIGGPTGPALNPARDLGPRILHQLLPQSILGPHKGDSKWWYSWVPVVAPITASMAGVAVFKYIYL